MFILVVFILFRGFMFKFSRRIEMWSDWWTFYFSSLKPIGVCFYDSLVRDVEEWWAFLFLLFSGLSCLLFGILRFRPSVDGIATGNFCFLIFTPYYLSYPPFPRGRLQPLSCLIVHIDFVLSSYSIFSIVVDVFLLIYK